MSQVNENGYKSTLSKKDDFSKNQRGGLPNGSRLASTRGVKCKNNLLHLFSLGNSLARKFCANDQLEWQEPSAIL